MKFLLLIFAFVLSPTSWGSVINKISDLDALLKQPPQGTPRTFQLSGLVTYCHPPSRADPNWYFILDDGTGRIECWSAQKPAPPAGQVIQISGTAHVTADGHPWIVPDMSTVRILGTRPVPPPRKIRIGEIVERQQAYEALHAIGTVVEVLQDEIDESIDFILLKDGAATLPVAVYHGQFTNAYKLLDAEISVSGIYRRNVSGKRMFSGPYLDALSSTRLDELQILRPAPANAFDWPLLEPNATLTPREIASMGKRSTTGVVLAAWGDNKLLIRAAGHRLVGIELRKTTALPTAGACIRVAGYPITDLYNINLTKASCQIISNGEPVKSTARPVTADVLLRNKHGRVCFEPDVHGQLLSITGEVYKRPASEKDSLLIKCDNTILPVSLPTSTFDDFSNLCLGSIIKVTGVCVLETTMWNPYLVFPQINNIRIVVRHPEDIRILSRPPWWTPARLLVVIAGLLLALGAFVVWNRVLNRLVSRRGHELFEAQIAETASALKVEERTRLAAELHDALSQNLSAVACQVSAAKSTVSDNTETQALLTTAERMLQSSRTELTRCLWDLRGDALEETDFTRAIENTLRRLSLKADLHVRFNVLRPRVDDTTAHAILCIVRELVTNAVKHGKATEVRVAGETHEDVISFSVRDNGTGFDTEHADGTDTGHFGLEGIRDRTNRLNGTFEITSSVGHGTKAVVTLPLGHESTATEFTA